MRMVGLEAGIGVGVHTRYLGLPGTGDQRTGHLGL